MTAAPEFHALRHRRRLGRRTAYCAAPGCDWSMPEKRATTVHEVVTAFINHRDNVEDAAEELRAAIAEDTREQLSTKIELPVPARGERTIGYVFHSERSAADWANSPDAEGLDYAESIPLVYGQAMIGIYLDGAVLIDPPRDEDRDWVESSLKTRLKPGAELRHRPSLIDATRERAVEDLGRAAEALARMEARRAHARPRFRYTGRTGEAYNWAPQNLAAVAIAKDGVEVPVDEFWALAEPGTVLGEPLTITNLHQLDAYRRPVTMTPTTAAGVAARYGTTPDDPTGLKITGAAA